jgi:hypothetical protein
VSDRSKPSGAASRLVRGFIGCGWLFSILVAALIFGAIFGGISFAAATEFNLKLVEKLVCPETSSITFRLGAYESDFEFPSASNPIGSESGGRPMTIYCLREGEIADSGNSLLVRTLALIFSGYFLACFLALLILSGVLQWWIRRRLSAA